MKCKNCGAELEENWKFCPNCCSTIKKQSLNGNTVHTEIPYEKNNITVCGVLLLIQFGLIFINFGNHIGLWWIVFRIIFSCATLYQMLHVRDNRANSRIIDVLIIIQVVYLFCLLPIVVLRDCVSCINCRWD